MASELHGSDIEEQEKEAFLDAHNDNDVHPTGWARKLALGLGLVLLCATAVVFGSQAGSLLPPAAHVKKGKLPADVELMMQQLWAPRKLFKSGNETCDKAWHDKLDEDLEWFEPLTEKYMKACYPEDASDYDNDTCAQAHKNLTTAHSDMKLECNKSQELCTFMENGTKGMNGTKGTNDTNGTTWTAQWDACLPAACHGHLKGIKENYEKEFSDSMEGVGNLTVDISC